MRKQHALLLSLAALLLIPSAAQAHMLWAYADPASKTVQLEVAESPGQDIAPILGNLAGQIELKGAKNLKAQGTGLAGDMTSTVATFKLIYGLHGSDLVTWWAKAGASLADIAKPSSQEFEIVATRKGHGLVGKLTHNGKPVSGQAVEAYGKGITKGIAFKTDAKGSFQIPTIQPGRLALGAMIHESIAGQFKGQAYKGKYNIVSLTVNVSS